VPSDSKIKQDQSPTKVQGNTVVDALIHISNTFIIIKDATHKELLPACCMEKGILCAMVILISVHHIPTKFLVPSTVCV